MNAFDASTTAVTFQALGTLLVALLFTRFAWKYSWSFARQWAVAWFAMFVALASVRISITTGQPLWWVLYLLGQWTFLVLLSTGSRELTGRRNNARVIAMAIPFACLMAVAIVVLSPTFNHVFTIEAGIVALGAACAFHFLGHFSVGRRTSGWRLLRFACLVMAVQYALYVPLYALEQSGFTIPSLGYSSLADLLMSVLLGFSMLFVTHEESERESEDRVTALQFARDHLEEQARTDPLTQLLNRHAFRVMRGGRRGAVVMVDVDGLKQINDRHGHAAGDAVIRTAAKAVREHIRPDDLLFRWGGDEFLLLMPNASPEVVADRLRPLAAGVTVTVRGAGEGLKFALSWGVAEFTDDRSLDEAMRAADAEMYARRAARRVS